MPASLTSGQAPTDDLVLVGVVITADRSVALLESGAAGAGGTQVVRVGGSIGGYRLTEIQADRVTVETPRGERVVVPLSAGRGIAPLPPAVEVAAAATESDAALQAAPPQLSARQRRRLERARLEAERIASGQPPPIDPTD